MTVKEALRAIHKRRCEDCACINCEYLAGECDDPEVKEIAEVLHLYPLTIRTVNGQKIGYVHDHSGKIVFPEDFKTKPEKTDGADDEEVYTSHLIEIGLLDE